MEKEYLQKLVDQSMTREELLQKVQRDFSLLPIILQGVSSSKPAIRYSCSKILMEVSAKHPQPLYQYMDFFVTLLESKYRILTWNAMAIIANLTTIDHEGKFEAVFDKYYSFINDAYMVTVANLIGNSGKIAVAKPHLVEKITDELLKVEQLSITPHLTEECRRVIAEHAIKSFDLFFDQVEQKAQVLAFVERQRQSSRKTLRNEAEKFLKKHS